MSDFICNPTFPTREIHLIAGASGAGKSTLASQVAASLMAGTDIFGIPVERPQFVAYLAFDRSQAGMQRTFERALDGNIPFPYYSTVTSKEFNKPEYRTAPGAVARIQELHPELDVIIIDGIGMAFHGESASLVAVAEFVHRLINILHKSPHPLTIIALHHMGKVKKGNEYAAARSKLHGSVAWAATAETCILVEPEAEDDPENPHRRITLCPRNAAERVYTYAFDQDGKLIPAADLVKQQETVDPLVLAVRSMPEDEIITTSKLIEAAELIGISESTVHRRILLLLEDGVLHRAGRGKYRRSGSKLIQLQQI